MLRLISTFVLALSITFSALAHSPTKFKGALVYKADGADQIVSPGIPGIAPITFQKVLYDTCRCWDSTKGRFVIPKGARFAKLSAQAVFQSGPALPNNSGVRQIVIKKNFRTLTDWYSNRPGWAAGHVSTHTATTVDVNVSGPVLPVVAGDDFLVDAYVYDGPESSPVRIRGANGTWFSIELIE